MREKGKSAIIGSTCILTYIVNYYLRHILSVLTPTLLATGKFSVEHIANLSSAYMILYAAGQLINGFLGDIFSPKNIACLGLCVSGCAMVIFPFMPNEFMQILCFACFGFGLAMLRGPLMKIISENTKPSHASLICVFFSFASFAGPLVASCFALINGWNFTFIAAGGVAILLGALAHIVFSILEKRKIITYMKTEVKSFASILDVFKIENIAFYIIVACLVEISAASISQWLTTYLTIPLGFSQEMATGFYSVISICRSLMPFVTLGIYRAVRGRDMPMMRIAFAIAAILFLALIIAPNRWVSIVFTILALMAMSCSSALLWSIYLPSLGRTGRVSSVNGVIDCIGYIAAAGANLVFANMMGNNNWNLVYVLWASVGIVGLIATFIFNQNKKKAK
jgi:sugar phosphate permease